LFEEVYKEEEEEYTRRELEKREKSRQQKKKKEQKQELVDPVRQMEFPGSDDILPMLEKVRGTCSSFYLIFGTPWEGSSGVCFNQTTF
jgi:hypothetical protein